MDLLACCKNAHFKWQFAICREQYIEVLQTERNTLYFDPCCSRWAASHRWILFHQLCTYWIKHQPLHLETGFSKLCIISEDHTANGTLNFDVTWRQWNSCRMRSIFKERVWNDLSTIVLFILLYSRTCFIAADRRFKTRNVLSVSVCPGIAY